jgi:histidinol dehydrogenase
MPQGRRYARPTVTDLLRRLDLRGVPDATALLPPLGGPDDGPVEAVRAILDDVRRRGDAALRELTRRFDGVDLDDLKVPPGDVAAAADRLEGDLLSALAHAADAILDFHRDGARGEHVYRRDGVTVRSIPQPVDRAGIYVPGGLAAYPSTVLMTALPARAAGVGDLVVCVPPGPGGSVPDTVLAAAHLCGIDEVVRVGGAQAIAAMAFGTESIAAVDVVAGPGNVYVAIAKQLVAGHVGIAAAFAGPSEIVVVADSDTPPTSAAIDLVVQAEHGPGGRAWLITWDEAVADKVLAEMATIVEASPRRRETMATLSDGGFVALVDGPAQAAVVANAIAPEHLQLMNGDPAAVLGAVRHAGAVFVGPWSPASVGDYVAGPSHVLPTAGTARFAGALGVEDFQKRMHVIEVSREGFDGVRAPVATLARAEGLPAHADSVWCRAEWADRGTVRA